MEASPEQTGTQQTYETSPQPSPQQTSPESPQQEQKLNVPYATYRDYTNNRLSCTPAEQKMIPGTGPQANPPQPPQYYYQIPLMYNLGTGESKVLSDFMLEGCEMETGSGIQSKTGPSGRMEHSVMCRFNNNNPEHVRFIETMNQLHGGSAYILQQMKGAVKLYNFNAQMAEATGLKNPVYRARDEMTGEPIQGRAPSMFLKLFSHGKPPMVEQTLFTGLDGKPIPWTLMQNVEMKFIPLIHIKRIYVGGGKASIQMQVLSAIVTSIRARNSTTRQLSTIHRLQAERPELADTVAAQLAKLTTDRQDQMLGTAPASDTTQDGDQPTFSGITPTGQRQGVDRQNSPSQAQGASPQNMQDFTADAPPRLPAIPALDIPGANTNSQSPTPTVQFN